MYFRSLALFVLIAFQPSLAFAQSMQTGWLGPPPVAWPMQHESRTPLRLPMAVAALPDVDNANRYEVGVLFQETWAAQAAVPLGWNGNVGSCLAGSNTAAHRQAVIDRVNLYRVVAGLPGSVVLKGGNVVNEVQQAALMFSANDALSHSPPSSWDCWTQAGRDGAGESNIYISWGSNAGTGVHAVDAYMDDDGSGNYRVGHRRWILYPPQQAMDSGSIPWSGSGGPAAANALAVLVALNGSRPATPDGIPWPARGYMPAQMLPEKSHRWSLSLRNADFSSASVQMWKNGVALPAPAIEPLSGNGQPNGPFYGDNTLVWVPSGVNYNPTPAVDVTYHVKVSGIGGSGVPSMVEYDVIMFDAMDPIFADGFE